MQKYYINEATKEDVHRVMNEYLAIHCTDTGDTYKESKIWKTPFGFEVCIDISGSTPVASIRRGSGGTWLIPTSIGWSNTAETVGLVVGNNFMVIGYNASSLYRALVLYSNNGKNYLTYAYSNSTYYNKAFKFEDSLNANAINVSSPVYTEFVNGQPVILDSIIDGEYCDTFRILPVALGAMTRVPSDFPEVKINGINHLYISTGKLILKD